MNINPQTPGRGESRNTDLAALLFSIAYSCLDIEPIQL